MGEPGVARGRLRGRAHACVLRAVHRVRRARRRRWRWAQVTFWCPEERLYHLWLQTLRELLEALSTCLLALSAEAGVARRCDC